MCTPLAHCISHACNLPHLMPPVFTPCTLFASGKQSPHTHVKVGRAGCRGAGAGAAGLAAPDWPPATTELTGSWGGAGEAAAGPDPCGLMGAGAVVWGVGAGVGACAAAAARRP